MFLNNNVRERHILKEGRGSKLNPTNNLRMYQVNKTNDKQGRERQYKQRQLELQRIRKFMDREQHYCPFNTTYGESTTLLSLYYNLWRKYNTTVPLRGGAPIRTNFPHFLTKLFKSNIFGLYVFKLEEARIFFCEKSYGCHGNGGHLGKYCKFSNR